MENRPALGKGLSALIPDGGEAFSSPRGSLEVDIDQLEPNHYQPRSTMDDAKLEELARSIRTNGVYASTKQYSAAVQALRARFRSDHTGR